MKLLLIVSKGVSLCISRVQNRGLSICTIHATQKELSIHSNPINDRFWCECSLK